MRIGTYFLAELSLSATMSTCLLNLSFKKLKRESVGASIGDLMGDEASLKGSPPLPERKGLKVYIFN
jgi:hypothetical protein